ncbi:tRNA (guanine-N1)-methyltransferase [secondary endosymbiont of Heteropsylla cubana]|uniref:tRNA (guanine-N(1)-)-methyltransferase n=1 Tax=secondary endosymbiont of Heteropsylla cubana TaxID=134287 RepID=J3TYQ8_9ENTR|nr:tRNA (guanosine(37)-N1)-methyltransferase TrmD [secondary endosymbiont of Heteropsylla cubana]AFP85550.1 tRNA (guanine-N1)-methyltransferase [secondary endosymbiont of Heteropsylla cubana]
MWIGIISLFPEMFRAITDYGITGRAVKNSLLVLEFWNPRDFALNKYRVVDDHPYGGGSGMIMMFQPLRDAIHEAKNIAGKGIKVIYLSPQGRKLDQEGVAKLASNSKMILVCGRYKGIDERLITTEINEEWSIGDYILSGGELAAMVLIDSISRLISGVLGNNDSSSEDSFSKGLLDCPHYTRPGVFSNIEVPRILLSGDHKKIRFWRMKQSLGRTWLRRPELLKSLILTKEQITLLTEFQGEYQNE